MPADEPTAPDLTQAAPVDETTAPAATSALSVDSTPNQAIANASASAAPTRSSDGRWNRLWLIPVLTVLSMLLSLICSVATMWMDAESYPSQGSLLTILQIEQDYLIRTTVAVGVIAGLATIPVSLLWMMLRRK